MLKDIAKKYVSLRGITNLYLITSHHDKDHVHLHVASSGVQTNGRSARMSRSELHQLKVAMDEFQLSKYKELSNSLPEHGRSLHERNKEAFHTAIKNERASEKNALLEVLRTSFEKSSSQEQFLALLQSEGYSPYSRNGVLTGVKDIEGMKFRLNRLGYTNDKLQELDARKEREIQTLREILDIRQDRTSQRAIQRDLTRADTNERTQEEATVLDDISSIRESASRDNSRDKEIEHDEPEEEGPDYSPSQNETDEDDY